MQDDWIDEIDQEDIEGPYEDTTLKRSNSTMVTTSSFYSSLRKESIDQLQQAEDFYQNKSSFGAVKKQKS